ncbi:MAG TPA: MerR family transcriptional regulator [Candidatus Sulfotelmatobacter sp.]|nr:MerR family transcriptional regulator [Candidatus Sulfotelmatobacter sp.]
MPATTPSRPALLSVAEAAARLGLSTRTLRYYEELGFLTPARTPGGHRLYAEADLELIARITRMQQLGFTLATIRKVLRYRSYQDESGRHRLGLDSLREIAAEARSDAQALRDRIAHLRRELDEATREAEALDHDIAYFDRRVAEEESRVGGR